MARGNLVGALALGGTILYLSEWLVIPFVPDLPTDDLGDDVSAIAVDYAGHGTELALLTGCVSVALLGRIVFVAALRSALRASGDIVLADIAVAAMTLSVAIEVVQLGLVSSAAWLGETSVDPAAIAGLDAAGTVLFGLVLIPFGASVLASSAAMLLSERFPRWLCWLGIVAGAFVVLGGVVGTAGAGDSGTLHDLGDPLTGLPVAAVWVWMIVTSVVLFRGAPEETEPTPEAA
jgi:hypothetical protein